MSERWKVQLGDCCGELKIETTPVNLCKEQSEAWVLTADTRHDDCVMDFMDHDNTMARMANKNSRKAMSQRDET